MFAILVAFGGTCKPCLNGHNQAKQASHVPNTHACAHQANALAPTRSPMHAPMARDTMSKWLSTFTKTANGMRQRACVMPSVAMCALLALSQVPQPLHSLPEFAKQRKANSPLTVGQHAINAVILPLNPMHGVSSPSGRESMQPMHQCQVNG